MKRQPPSTDQEKSLVAAAALIDQIEMHCPCGARPESLNTHPHVPGCPVEELKALMKTVKSALSKREQAASAAALEKAADLLKGKAGDMWYCDRAQEIVRSLIDPPAQSALDQVIQSAREAGFDAGRLSEAEWWFNHAGDVISWEGKPLKLGKDRLAALRASVEQP